MRIRHLRISNFRGIKTLDWHVQGSVVCLIGPGDSTKTTILDAIDYALAPRQYLPISDADFYGGSPNGEAIEIDVTLGEIPAELWREPDKFGLHLRGYRDNKIIDEPDDDCEKVVTVRVRVTETLQAEWRLHTERNSAIRELKVPERARFGAARIGEDTNLHLTWGRGSALSRHRDLDFRSAMANARVQMTRAARDAFDSDQQAPLHDLGSDIRNVFTEFGVRTGKLVAGLDIGALSFGGRVLGICDGRIPLCAFGLGTRRLAAISIQHAALQATPILLIDEIEYGLEPHRIAQLLRKLKERYERPVSEKVSTKVVRKAAESANNENSAGQIFMTTHSPTALLALDARHLAFVRREANGRTVVSQCSGDEADAIQGTLRKHPHAVLSPNIIVAEGATEEGFLRGLDEWWSKKHKGCSPAYHGTQGINGGGRTIAPGRALNLNNLGYRLAYFGDSDKPTKPPAADLRKAGIDVFLWSDETATETRLAADLPWEAFLEMVELALSCGSPKSILGQINDRLPADLRVRDCKLTDCESWDIGSREKIRQVVGEAATVNEWFKDVTQGEKLGKLVGQHLAKIEDSGLAKTLSDLERWIYAE